MGIKNEKDTCEYCGAWKGLHRYSDLKCPDGGVDSNSYTGERHYLRKSPLEIAAPALLTALKRIVALSDPEISGSKGSALEDAKAAIVKAEGRAE